MKKIVLTLFGIAGAWLTASAQNQPFTINFHNDGTLGINSFRVTAGGNCQSACWNQIIGGSDQCNGAFPEIPAGGMVSWVVSAAWVGQTFGNGIPANCAGAGTWSDNSAVLYMAGLPFTAASGGIYDVYLYGGHGGGSSGGPPPLTTNRTQQCYTNNTGNVQYVQFSRNWSDGAGAHSMTLGSCGSFAPWEAVNPGSAVCMSDMFTWGAGGNVNDSVNPANAYMSMLVAGSEAAPCNSSIYNATGDCIALCSGDGTPYNGAGASNVFGGSYATNGSTSGGGGVGPWTYSPPYDPNSNGPINFTATNQSQVDAQGFDALYDVDSKILATAHQINANIVSGFNTLDSRLASQYAGALTSNINPMVASLNGLSNTIANWGSGSGGSNGPIIWTEPASMSNQLVGIESSTALVVTNLQGLTSNFNAWAALDFSNGFLPMVAASASNTQQSVSNTAAYLAAMSNLWQQLPAAVQSNTAALSNQLTQVNTNLQNESSNIQGLARAFSNAWPTNFPDQQAIITLAGMSNLLATISNNTAQPNLYTNVGFGSVYPTNASDIGNLGSNQVTGVSQSLQALGDTLNANADSINGNGPGGDGSIYTVQAQVPGPSGGMVTYTFDMNPMDYPAIVDLAAFVRKAMTWVIGVGFLLKMFSDISAAVGQMMSTAQGQVPRVTILGNTVGWVAAGVYLIGIVGVMVGLPLFIVTYLTSSGFGPSLWSQVQTNPFSSSGYGAAMVGALWLADKFVPLYFVVATIMYYAAFRLFMVRLIMIVAAVVRAFMA